MIKILKWIKRIFVAILGLLIIVILGLWVSFYFWNKEVIKNLPNDTKVISTDHGPIEYSLDGNSNKVILFVHGTSGSAHVSRLEALTYIDNGFSLLSVSRPGYYKTPLSSGETVKQQATLFRSLLDELGIDSVYINGASGGGPSSIQFAIDYPERCSGLILRAAVSEKIEFNSEELGVIERLFMTGFGQWLGIQIALTQLDDPEKTNMDTYVKIGMFPWEKTEVGLKNDFKQFDSLEDMQLEEIKAPTIIIHGNKDENVPFSFALKASKRIPNATLIEMEGKDHFVFFTSYADTINHEIVQFINSQEELRN